MAMIHGMNDLGVFKVQYILQEIVQGGLVADTNVQSIVDMHKAQEKYAKQHG